ncbi:MAG TPA: hypothetical protein VFT66_00050 [Roseiflexaceae bacterium]|jgi:hypothetical protein|nr:hypothetical protein [Roseiflexaceae bacterium]
MPGIRLDHVWVLFALALVGGFIALVPTPPNDFWWHLKAGQLVAAQGIPHTNLFAWTLPADTPYVYATWLGEWLFYVLYRAGGLGLVVFARNMLALAGFGLVTLEARRRSGSWRLAALAVLLAAAMSTNNLIIRTQNWSWVPVGLYALVLGAYAAGQARPRMLALLPLTMMFWVNAHGAFVVGLALVGVYAVGETLRRLVNPEGALSWYRVRMLYGALFATLAATLANPLGFGIFGYVRNLLTDPPSQGLIVEWQAPTPHTLAGFFFYVSLLVLVVAFAYARRRPTITEVLLTLAFTWEAWNGVRYVMWFGMVIMPIVVQCIARPRTARLPQPSSANLVLAGLFAALLIAVQPPFKAQLPLPPEYKALFATLPDAPEAFSAGTPVAATEWLREHAPPGMRLFNEMGYGSYLDWALYPQGQSFIDPRVELFPLQQWQDYIEITKGRNYNALLTRYGVTHVMLDHALQPALSKAMAADPGWQRMYKDDQTAIYERR